MGQNGTLGHNGTPWVLPYASTIWWKKNIAKTSTLLDTSSDPTVKEFELVDGLQSSKMYFSCPTILKNLNQIKEPML